MSNRIHQNGFVTVAAASPALRLGDPAANATLIIQALEKAAQEGVEIVVLPELCLTATAVATSSANGPSLTVP